MVRSLFVREVKGGAGSGNFGHEGRPGERGGSGGGEKKPTEGPSSSRFETVFGKDWKDRVEGKLGSDDFAKFDDALAKQDEMIDHSKSEVVERWSEGGGSYDSFNDFVDSNLSLEDMLSETGKASDDKLLAVVSTVNEYLKRVVDEG